MVRLKHTSASGKDMRLISFNSSMVRLKLYPEKLLYLKRHSCFNSSMVRLKLA